ncbi:MAG: alpha-L-fucosidase, partial [Planctomycetota bacterium]
KHHEGFCLWDSKHTDYKVTRTPYGRDLLSPMVDAFRGHGLRTGFYHSLLDWNHPDYVVDHNSHPMRDVLADPAAAAEINAGRDQSKYAAYLQAQVRELLTDFGDVDMLWFDFSFVANRKPDGSVASADDFTVNKGREAWRSEALYDMIRELRPGVLLTDRLNLDMPLSGGDIKTPEQSQPWRWVHVDGKPVTWEACQTFSGSWGYHRDEHDWRSTRQLLTTLIDCVSKGGNLLLNVGPNGRGEIDARALDRLHGIGEWMRLHDRSIYGCTQAPDDFECPKDARLTYHPEKNRLYVHLLSWPYKFLHLFGKSYVERVEYAQLLNDASECRFDVDAWHAKHLDLPDHTLTLNLPQREPHGVEIPVLELFLK